VIRPKLWYRYLLGTTLAAMLGGLALEVTTAWRPTGLVSAAILLALLAVGGPPLWNRREIYRAYSGDPRSMRSVTAGRFSLFEQVGGLPRG
jgi:hypothetical protein